MIDTESYGVSGRQLLSSKQVPDSGRVCSCRNPRAWPSSWPMMSPGSQLPEFCSETALTRTLRLRSGLLGKKARAMYCVVLVGSTENSTVLLRVVQFVSADATWV